MSGASEATLQELLQVNQQMAASIAKMAGGGSGGGGSGGGGGGAAGSAGLLGKAFNAAGASVGIVGGLMGKMLSPAIEAASAGFGLLAQSGKVLFANQMQLAQGAIAGTNSLASMTAGLEQLPGILGFAMKAYNFQIQVLEKNYQTYTKLADTGATLSGNLNEVRTSAKGMYLSMDEFAGVMKQAQGQFLNFGPTADDGARAMIKFNSAMVKGDTGRAILGMGYSLEQANGMLATMSETMGGVTADQLKDQRGMEKSVKAFSEELALSAELEGKTREQKEKEMKERAQDAVRESMLSKMSAEEKQAYLEAENRANMIGGKGARDALLAATMGLPPMTKEAQMFAATNQKANQAVMGMKDALQDTTLSEGDRQKKIQQYYGEGAKAAADNAAQYGKAGIAMAMGSGRYADAMKANLTAETNARKQNLTSAEAYIDRENKARENLAKAQNSEAGATAQRIGASKYAGEELMNALYSAFKPLIDIILKANEIFLKFLPIATTFVAGVITKGVAFLTDIFSKVDWEVVKKSFMGAWDMLTGTFGNIYNAVTKAMGGGSGGIAEFLQKGMVAFFDTLKGVIQAVGLVVVKFVESDLFQTLKQTFFKMWELIKVLVDAVVTIIQSPVGQFVIDVIFDTFDVLFKIVNTLIDAIVSVVKVIANVVSSVSGDFKATWEKVKAYIGNLITSVIDWFKSIPKKVTDFFGEGNVLEGIWDALKGIIGSIVDGIKAIGSKIVNFFKSDSSAPAAPGAPPTASAPNGSNMPPMTAEAQKKAAEDAKKAAPVTANNTGNVPVVQPKSNDPIEILRAEIQTLNNITTEMLKAMRDTRDYSKSTANTLASNGNLFKRA